jgi:diacylglycerol kinase family enzyme
MLTRDSSAEHRFARPRLPPFEAEIEVDGKDWYEGQTSLVLFGNVGEVFAGVKAFDNAQPDDGLSRSASEAPTGSSSGVARSPQRTRPCE